MKKFSQIKQNKLNKVMKKYTRRRVGAGLFNTSSAGAYMLLIVMALCGLIGINSINSTNNAYAAASTLTISVADSVGLNIVPTSDNGTFMTSSTSTNNVSVSTTNGTGYTLGIKASSASSNALVNSSNSSKTIPSITSSISESTYSTSSTYNNTWGYRPSKLNSEANSNYLQAPTSSGTITTIDQTTVANASTTNNYNIAIGARVTNATSSGTYSNAFVLTVVANPSIYSITYNANAGSDTVSDMPTNISNQTTSGTTINISSTTPTYYLRTFAT